MLQSLGWVNDPDLVKKLIQTYNIQPIANLAGFAENAIPASTGKFVNLAENFRLETGHELPIFNQKTNYDCVGHSVALAATVLSGLTDGAYLEIASEPIYAGAKYTNISPEYPCTKSGAILLWGVIWIAKTGLFARKSYGTFNLIDYAPELARRWACTGVPTDVTANASRLTTYYANTVCSYEDARAAITDGRPVVIGTNTLFKTALEDENIGTPMDSGRNGHCYCALGVNDRDGKPKILCYDSMGKFYYREKSTARPRPSFWVTVDVFNKMIEAGEAYSIGYRPDFS